MEAPEFYHSLESKHSGDHFIVEDLLDFSNEDAAATDGGSAPPFDSTESSAITVVDSCNSSSFSGSEPCLNGADIASHNNFSNVAAPDAAFAGDLCVPYDDLAELEWLSNFVEESFSSDDLQKLHLISGMKARPEESSDNGIHDDSSTAAANSGNNPIFHHEIAVPAKARSKRSRVAAGNWASRLLLLSPTATPTSSSEGEAILVPTPHNPNGTTGKKTIKAVLQKKREGGGGAEGGAGNMDGRKCLHCQTDKTPLCLIHQHVGPDFRQLI